MSFDMNKLMQQAAQMQEQVQRMQEDAEKETAEASVGGGMVKVTANGAGQVLSIEISPDAIDPSDPEGLADLVLAGVNEALRSASRSRRGEGAGDAVGAPRRAGAARPRRVAPTGEVEDPAPDDDAGQAEKDEGPQPVRSQVRPRTPAP